MTSATQHRPVFVRTSSISNFDQVVSRAGFVARPGLDAPVMAAIFDEVYGIAELESFAAAHPGTPILLVTSGLARETLAACIAIPSLLSVSQAGRPDDLFEALSLLSQPGTSPLRERWLPGNALSREVASSVERDRLLEEVELHLRGEGLRARFVNLARDAIEELVTNALYDAPVDSTGRRIYLETDRRNAIFLPPAARPRLDLAVLEGRIVAVMTDPHGSLELETVRRFLAAGLLGQISDKPGGAGLGFARVFGFVDRLAIHIAPRVRTDIGFVLETRQNASIGRHAGLQLARS